MILEFSSVLKCHLMTGSTIRIVLFYFILFFCIILFLFFVCSFYFYYFFPFIFIHWRLITLQYCSGFCHTLT